MIAAWLAAQGLFGIKNQWWVLGAILIATASATVISVLDNRDKRMIETAKDSGASEAVVAGQRTTLTQNKDANDAEDQVRRGGSAAVDGCVSDARGDASGCERFRN